MSPCVEIEERGVNILEQGYSFKAVNVKNDIVGILLNSYISREVKTKIMLKTSHIIFNIFVLSYKETIFPEKLEVQ